MAPETWLRAIEDCSNDVCVTLITGPPNSGKSTFARRLVNRHLTGLGKMARPATAVCYLDLDPSKQEYAPHGQISLVLAREINLSPAFTHPATTPDANKASGDAIIHAHAIPTNIANYTNYYQLCVEDLFLRFKNLQSHDSSLSLVIDTPGSLYASNFNILDALLVRIRPHNTVHLRDTNVSEGELTSKMHLLQTTASRHRSTFHDITAQGPLITPLRNETELQAMHMQSYFHVQTSSTRPSESQTVTWMPNPLSQLVPWEFCYQATAERTQDIVGFAVYTEPIEPASLIHALNGSIVQIVQSASSIVPRPYTALPRTGRYQLPYFPQVGRTGMVEPLDPRTSTLVCTAMVRGFDPERKTVQVVLPQMYEPALHAMSAERTVLISGCCSMPEWAFSEETYARKGAVACTGSAPVVSYPSEQYWVGVKGTIEDMGYLDTVRRVRKFQT